MTRKYLGIPACGIAGLIVLLALTFCSGSGDADRPNILFIVWDTVRADRMSLYGHDNPTTPFLDEWARGARVFDNCTSTGSSTVPSHGAMFTGKMPTEHGANNSFKHLDDSHKTLAEILRDGGYRTYLFAANPHISSSENFQQGFETEEHPWDRKYRKRAFEILEAKLDPRDESSELPEKVRNQQLDQWSIKAAGELAAEGLFEWLDRSDPERPFFAFLNYMEAHRPFIPSLEARQKVMTPEQVDRSYQVDRSWQPMWGYTFGLHEYEDEELEAMALTYDACIVELDALFRDLVAELEQRELLDNTVIVLTSDHGEHLGEQHMLDHQYSVYEGLIRVPLVIYHPARAAPGRDSAPVVNFDLFPTLLDLAGLEPPPRLKSQAIDLLDPEERRQRVAEYPADFERAITKIQKVYPDWDPTPFRRKLWALYHGDYKLIFASDGTHELYDLSKDPEELEDLAGTDAELLQKMEDVLKQYMSRLTEFEYDAKEAPRASREQMERLKALGYVDGGD